MNDARSRSAAVAALVLFSGCANQAPPPGGPPDRIPPRVVATVPAEQAVGVAVDTPIEVTFSEHMDRRSVERSVFVSPRAESDPELKWKGRRLVIRMPTALRPDRTYRVSIGAESADEARNRMSSSYDFAFSTGDRISHGEIRGTIRLESGDAHFVWAYDVGDRDPDPGLDIPSYVTQAGTEGSFRFPGLGRGSFRVFVFSDVDRDRTYTAGTDALGLPPTTVELPTDGSSTVIGAIRAVVRDTTGSRLIAGRTSDQTHVRLRFDEDVATLGTVEIEGLTVHLSHVDPGDSTAVWVLTSPQTEGANYEVLAKGFTDARGNTGPPSSVTVKGDGRPDTRAPAVVSVSPPDGSTDVPATAPVTIVFDEAMDPVTRTGLWVEMSDQGDSTGVLSGTYDWTAPNVLAFEPYAAWSSGAHFLETAESLVDAGGNSTAESVRVRFTTTADALEGSLTGRLAPAPYATVVTVRVPGDVDYARAVRVAPGDTTFAIERLRTGRYVVEVFGDPNDDGEWDAGRVSPFRPAEPVAVDADTVEVPPRWESTIDRVLRTMIVEVDGEPTDG